MLLRCSSWPWGTVGLSDGAPGPAFGNVLLPCSGTQNAFGSLRARRLQVKSWGHAGTEVSREPAVVSASAGCCLLVGRRRRTVPLPTPGANCCPLGWERNTCSGNDSDMQDARDIRYPRPSREHVTRALARRASCSWARPGELSKDGRRAPPLPTVHKRRLGARRWPPRTLSRACSASEIDACTASRAELVVGRLTCISLPRGLGVSAASSIVAALAARDKPRRRTLYVLTEDVLGRAGREGATEAARPHRRGSGNCDRQNRLRIARHAGRATRASIPQDIERCKS
jgi:hypothetical protein